jgi:hypothetical protein
MKTPLTQLNLSSIEHVRVKYHIAETHSTIGVLIHFIYSYIYMYIGKCVHRTPSGVRERPTCGGTMYLYKFLGENAIRRVEL